MSRTRGPGSILAAALAALALASAAAAQKDVTVSARLSAGVLRLGDTGTLDVTVENGRSARVLGVPEVEGLDFGRPSEPQRRSSTSIINGRVSSQSTLTFRIPFRATVEGDHEIPPLTVEADGQRFQTRALRVTAVRDISGADFGYLEVRSSSPRVVEGQPFTVELLFGWDADERVSFAELNLPWWDSLPGAIEGEERPIPPGQRVDNIEVNGRVRVSAEQLEGRQRGGRTFHTLRVTKTYLPSRSGTLEFPTSFFEFGTRRQVSFFDARRESHFVQAPAFTVEVVPLPSEGQPLGFSGAVGTFEARASVDSRDVRAGDSIKFAVEWMGSGNLEFFRAPDLTKIDAFRGFRVYGRTDEKSFDRRKVVYDITPLSSEVTEVPAVPLSYFDPNTGTYESVATQPIPIRVRALEGGVTLGDEEQRFQRDIADIDTRAPGTAGPATRAAARDRFLLGALFAVPLLGLLTRGWVRRVGGDPSAPLERRRRRARRALERALSRAGDPEGRRAALLEFLGARTREPAAAWNGRELGRWARESGTDLPEPVRSSADDLLAGLDAAVYGAAPAPEDRRILDVARELQEAGL